MKRRRALAAIVVSIGLALFAATGSLWLAKAPHSTAATPTPTAPAKALDLGAIPTATPAVATPAAPTPTSGEFAAFIRGEAQLLRRSLGLATGSLTCTGLCDGDYGLNTVGFGALVHCKKLDINGLRASKFYDGARDGWVLNALAAACGQLIVTESSLGAPTDSTGWRTAAKTAFMALNADPRILQ